MKKKNTLFYIFLALLVGTVVALDQWTKYLTIQRFPTPGLAENYAPGIKGIFHITHIANDGGAWGSFGGQTWLFLLVMVVFVVLMAYAIWKKWLSKKFEWICLAAILGGGIGNVVDRLFRDGKVTDMICLDFMEFPVFNVADCFITCGCIALMIYVLFFDREQKDAPKAEENAEE